MRTAVFLSDRNVYVVVGEGTHGSMTVTKTVHGVAPEYCIADGQVLNEEAFDRFFLDFWRSNGLPEREVTLVLGGSHAVTRILSVPNLSHRGLMKYLQREFSYPQYRGSLVLGYSRMGQDEGMVKLCVSAVERRILKPHIIRFRRMGIGLKFLVTSGMAGMLLLNELEYIRRTPCVVQILEGMTRINVICLNGQYYQHNTTRIGEERGTTAFGIESARSISGIQQFLKTQPGQEAVSHVYLAGEFLDEEEELCRESILQMDETLIVERLYADPDGTIRYPKDTGMDFGYGAMAAGGLLDWKKHCGLLAQYDRNSETSRQRSAVLRLLAPAALFVAALAGTSLVLALVWHLRMEQINRQLDQLGNQGLMEAAVEYDDLMAANEALAVRLQALEKTRENLASYPRYTSTIKQIILECAAETVEADITGYEAVSGILSLEVYSDRADGMHQFVERLDSRPDVFARVVYDGFWYDEQKDSWYGSVKCHLVPAPGGEGRRPHDGGHDRS